MDAKNGWRRLRIDAVRQILKDKELNKFETQPREVEVVSRLLRACDDDVTTGARPSLEAHLHSCLDKCVIHLHADAVGAFINAKNGKQQLEKLFKDEKLPPVWVPYASPGYMLAKKITKLVADYNTRFGRNPSILFLQKHGPVFSASSPDAALRLVRRVISRCNSKLKPLRAARIKFVPEQVIAETALKIRKGFFDATGSYTTIKYFYNETIAAFINLKNAKKMLASPAITADELLYVSGAPLWLENCDPKKIAAKLTSQIDRDEKPSVSFLVKGVGLFVAEREKMAGTVRDTVASALFVRRNAIVMGGIVSMNKKEREFINNWETNTFRRQLAAGSSSGQLQGRIAVVTGAGSGLGRSIVIGLAKAGTSVAIADIDTKAAQQTADMIKAQLPDAQTMVVNCNVTSQESVEQAFGELQKNWGGLDILVNAAGVAPAGSLVDLPVEKFRFAMEVNLTGYFLMAQAAAKIMIAQDIGGAIINISSKSGLDASKNNTPYNATKAGELHMARGWAMELGEYGIRVNCVCPGNVFEGSKIWNPEYIKVCAKKYGIKPEEVIPFYVNKTALKREIKGSDIADSVVFLCSDNARTITGQTIVADSGQVMVR